MARAVPLIHVYVSQSDERIARDDTLCCVCHGDTGFQVGCVGELKSCYPNVTFVVDVYESYIIVCFDIICFGYHNATCFGLWAAYNVAVSGISRILEGDIHLRVMPSKNKYCVSGDGNIGGLLYGTVWR